VRRGATHIVDEVTAIVVTHIVCGIGHGLVTLLADGWRSCEQVKEWLLRGILLRMVVTWWSGCIIVKRMMLRMVVTWWSGWIIVKRGVVEDGAHFH
jgi:hypothetical protein